MATYRKYQRIISGASGIEYQQVDTMLEALHWIPAHLTEAQQHCVIVELALKKVPDLFVSKAKQTPSKTSLGPLK